MGYEEESALCDAVRDAYDRGALEMVLYLKLGKSIDDISREANFEVTVFHVVMAAKRGGWLEAFVAAVLEGQPRNPKIQQWVARHAPAMGRQSLVQPSEASPPAWQLMDSAYFDLTEIRYLIREAMKRAAGQVVGFAATDPESMFIKKLSDWVRGHLGGDTESKDRLYLSPMVSNPGYWVRQVRDYRSDLDAVNVLFEVMVDSALPEAAIGEFWTRVCDDFAGVRRRLILMFTGSRDHYPDGVTVLPPPQFKRYDVALWAENVVRQRGWPLDLADAWTTWLCDRAVEEGKGDVLNVRRLYKAMDDSIIDFGVASSEEFRARLRNRIIA